MVTDPVVRRSDDPLLTLFAQVVDVVFIVDGEYRIVFVSPAAAEAWGARPDSMTGRNLWDVAAHDIGPVLTAALAETMEDREPRRIDEPAPSHGRWLRWTVTPAGEGVAARAHDVQDLYDTRRLLDQREASYRRTLELSGLIAAGIDSDLPHLTQRPQPANALARRKKLARRSPEGLRRRAASGERSA